MHYVHMSSMSTHLETPSRLLLHLTQRLPFFFWYSSWGSRCAPSLSHYLRSLDTSERTRVIALLYPCIFLNGVSVCVCVLRTTPDSVAAQSAYRLRVIIVGFHDEPTNDCWLLVQLVEGNGSPAGLPSTDFRWEGPYFDVERWSPPSDGPLPFQAILSRLETLLLLHAVLLLTGLEAVVDHTYAATVRSSNNETYAEVRIEACSEPLVLDHQGGGPRSLVVEDLDHGIRLIHRRPRHMELSPLLPLDGLSVVMVCPLCLRPEHALFFPGSRFCLSVDLGWEKKCMSTMCQSCFHTTDHIVRDAGAMSRTSG